MTLVYGLTNLRSLQKLPKDLLIWPRDKEIQYLPKVTRVLLMTRYIKHKEQDRVLKLYPRHMVTFVSGCVGSLKRELALN